MQSLYSDSINSYFRPIQRLFSFIPLLYLSFFVNLHVFSEQTNNNIMKISYKWLKEYVDFNLSPEEIAVALTSIGLEVGSLDEVETIRGGLKGLVCR